MALLKFIGGIRLSAALVKCGITLAVALLDLTAGIILTAKKVAISSTKSMTGHLLGASGGVEAIITTLAVKNDLIRGTQMSYEIIDGVLHFFVNYDVFVYKQSNVLPTMEDMEEEVSVKGR